MNLSTANVVLIDDDESMRAATAQWLELAGYHVIEFPGGDLALGHLEPDFGGVVVSDVKMPRMDGMELLERIHQRDPDLPVVLVTAHGDVPMAVEAIRKGAYDFIEKPFEPDRLLDVIQRACEKRRLVLENRFLRQKLADRADIERRLLGDSPVIQRLRQEIMEVADTDASVMIQGETGTGKEVVARCLHEFGRRQHGRFVAVNCAAVPESIFESELFGHESGAFTGATKRRIGKFEHAHGGTLFLDEISSMPLALQVKVLRSLQEREIVRLGSNEPRAIDIRLVSASNRDLQAACQDSTFREDLYYRLNVIEVRIPPLRDRGGDITLLFDYFAGRAAEAHDREAPPLPEESVAMLMGHGWPGNVRELRNLAERYVLSSLPVVQRVPSILRVEGLGAATSLVDLTRQFERRILEAALRHHRGNMADVMDALDLPRRTLNEKMQRLGLERKDYC
ncbi:sigma-54 dependent transcriptional regulator [Magnetospira sp. QH-2]|uniref:sigma-54-dependent transcriptional regulator n=1 Tax=Magnetospira sp. (strain QH-2) TaxID=1288970 RepID=UPI0003E81124|nr:sigma-54 dependent transcriptional regulator [Magnetospira sp. QH-2]CCQ73178.1 C4-dicarboxylate transport transcriptional regulatory protein (response regulator in two-component reguatory system) [Magnetospira sp. QH-2]